MKSYLDKNNSLTRQLQKWKKDQAIISLTPDEFKKEFKDKKFIIEQKIDGQSALLEYKSGTAKFGSLGGTIIWDLPLTDEIEKIMKRKGIKEITAVGELAAMQGGKIIGFDESESLIKNPKADKSKISWHPYQILEIDKEKIKDDFGSYKKMWPEIIRLFDNASHVRPVKKYEGSIPEFDHAWKILVEKQKNEGLVIRTENNKVIKCKPTYSYDLIIIAVGDKKKKNWPKKMIGTTLMAFMDEDRNFREAGEVGTGWTEEEKKELFSWAQKNKVGEDDTHVWVKPQKVMEVQWERSNIREMPSYKYSRGKYEEGEKLMSGTIVKPRFIRWRTDKSATPSDLRLTQIPDWEERKKTATRVVMSFLNRFADDPNNGKEVEVGITFDTKDFSKKDFAKLFQIQSLLSEIGVSFDTGFDFGTKGRDWEWDWSLKGPVKVKFKRFVEDDPENRYTKKASSVNAVILGFFNRINQELSVRN